MSNAIVYAYKTVIKTLFKDQQRVFFFVQLFGAISYSTLYSTLIFYATKSLHLSAITSVQIIASFIAYNYVLHLLGGYIGGTLLSYRSAYALSLLFLIVGSWTISFNTLTAFYWGLSIFLAGAGLVVTCFNCIVTQVYHADHARRETAFIVIYAGMNIGLLVGFCLSGYFELTGNYKILFLLGSIGTIIALIIWLSHWPHFADQDTVYANRSRKAQIVTMIAAFSIMLVLVPLLHQILQLTTLSHYLVLGLGILALFIIFLLGVKQAQRAARTKVFAYLILALSALLFWSLYLMAPMALNLFIAHNVARHFLTFTIAPQWIQTINTLGIILGAPVLVKLLQQLRANGKEISVPLQFSAALFMMGLSFACLSLGIKLANSHGYVNLDWVVISELFYSFSELLIAPIGYAMIGQLAPVNLQNIMMGTWMMITGLAATLSSTFSQYILKNITNNSTSSATNPIFNQAFVSLAIAAFTASCLIFFLRPIIQRLIKFN